MVALLSVPASPARRGFVKLPAAVLLHPDLSPLAKLLYGILRRYARQKGYCFPGCRRLAADLARSENTMRKAMHELCAAELVSVRRRGFTRTNVYYLTDPDEPNVVPPEPQSVAAHEPQSPAIKGEREKEEEAVRGFDSSNGLVPDGVEVTDEQTECPGIQSGPHHRHGRQAPPYDADRTVIRSHVADFARELNDRACLAATVTRAHRLYRQSGLTLDTFLEQMYAAREVTQERSARIWRVDTEGRKCRTAYFFAVLADRIGLGHGAAMTVAPDGETRGVVTRRASGLSVELEERAPALDRHRLLETADHPASWPAELTALGLPDVPTFVRRFGRGPFADPATSVAYALRYNDATG